MNAQPVDTVKRKCKWCGKKYVVPRGSKSEGCPTCAPGRIVGAAFALYLLAALGLLGIVLWRLWTEVLAGIMP